jgi:hypothetical protein
LVTDYHPRMAALSLIISAGTVRAGFLGHSLAEYNDQYADAYTSHANPNITLFRRDGLESDVIFYKDRAVRGPVCNLGEE